MVLIKLKTQAFYWKWTNPKGRWECPLNTNGLSAPITLLTLCLIKIHTELTKFQGQKTHTILSSAVFSHMASRVNRTVCCFFCLGAHIATDKRGYPHTIFLISRQKHMLWVLIRSASPRRF